MLLVTGCPRSGTRSTSTALRAGGLDIPHERIGKDGSVCWFYATRSSHYPWRVPVPDRGWDRIFHQVRDPLQTIASLTTISQVSWDWIEQYVALPIHHPLVDRCARFWLSWNERVERIAQWQYRVEDASAGEIARRAGLPWSGGGRSAYPHVNRREHGSLQWSAIRDQGVRRDCQNMAHRYGYKTPNDF